MGSIESTDGTRLHVTTRGHGPPIVLVHGWKGSSRVWDRTVAALEDRFLVVAYDLRGAGVACTYSVRRSAGATGACWGGGSRYLASR